MHILPNYVILQNLCVRVEQDVLTPHATIAVQLMVTLGASVTACVGVEVHLVKGNRLSQYNRKLHEYRSLINVYGKFH